MEERCFICNYIIRFALKDRLLTKDSSSYIAHLVKNMIYVTYIKL
ncbi:hypothetical protein HMPREF0518_2073 [Lactobacillus helveticus DSM 20075 = CGMCC 1.1877]|nr:hypothetical protein HMPREF0518_2073 [Lactobacillus helveticus DSM 20075 = CGMCC 1.1877]